MPKFSLALFEGNGRFGNCLKKSSTLRGGSMANLLAVFSVTQIRQRIPKTLFPLRNVCAKVAHNIWDEKLDLLFQKASAKVDFIRICGFTVEGEWVG